MILLTPAELVRALDAFASHARSKNEDDPMAYKIRVSKWLSDH